MPSEQKPKIILIHMPWATTTRPSLALGILASICHEEEVPVKTFYPNMDIAAMIGFELASCFADERILFGLSEHLFACDLFGMEALNSDSFIERLQQLDLPRPFRDMGYIKHLRDVVVGGFLNHIEELVLREEPTAVGFSATFNQVMASLALAKRIKKSRPDIQIIAGGACFHDEMGQEYHRAMSEILDHVFVGEGEEPFREYLRRHKARQTTHGIPGATYEIDGEVRLVPGRPLPNLNDSPMPDYDGFFLEKDRLSMETGKVFNIECVPFESSRGCWWGQKNHCVFCGINEDLMVFREKDVDRVVSEMVSLSNRYRVVRLTAADWITSKKSRARIFEKLKDIDLDVECFYETRADLSKEEISLMRGAGVVTVQSGIESFSTDLLRLMRKGTTRISNVQFLRWCKEFGIDVSYNVLAGFPGEKAEWYLGMADFLPKILHLQPPKDNMHDIEMHRFSPLFDRRHEFAIDEHQVREDYGCNFPEGIVDLDKIGYFFSFSSPALVDKETYAERVREALGRWIAAHDQRIPPVYQYTLGPGFLHILDTRDSQGRYLQLAGLHHDILLLCDQVLSTHKLKALLASLYPREVANGEFDKTVDEMLREDLLMSEGNLLLSLPIGYRPRTTKELTRYVLGEAKHLRKRL